MPKTSPLVSTLSFHCSLYLEEALRSAVEAFDSLATISMSEEGGQWVVSISEPTKHPLDLLSDEFANYALSETTTRHATNAS